MLNKYLKNQLILSFSACAILLGLNNLSASSAPDNNFTSTPAQLASTNPDPIFKPIFGNIKSQLPKGWSIRLPSKVYMTDYEGKRVQIYPRFDNQFENGVALFLDTQPNCQARACSFGLITMAKEHDGYNKNLLSSPIFPIDKLKRVWQAQQKYFDARTDAENNLMMEAEGAVLVREKINLAPGIQGHYVIRNAMGVSTPSGGAIIWEQDGFVYSVRGPGSIEEGQRWKTELISIARSMAAGNQSNIMTWQELKTFARQKNLAGLNDIIPSQYPNQFASGQVAITALSTGRFAYVVAREGVNIPNLSSVEKLSQTDISFNTVEIANAVEFPLPALKNTPDSLYNSSQLIEIVSWAARYDSEGRRSEARQSQQTTLPNGKKAYYLKQGNKQGWCTFMDESAQYSDYLCVNIANSPKTSLELLKSIVVVGNQNTASSVNQLTIPDSFEVLLDNNNNEMKSKFVKGSDGYYTWYLTDYFIPGTCLGLREHEDPTKVQVERYDCDSKKKAIKWEIVMTDDNTGYKIKLPNTDYCLGYETGIFDCDSSQAIVEKLTSEQLKTWRSKR